jgi:ribosomal protein RSM22 (predicted rRNA methylase)
MSNELYERIIEELCPSGNWQLGDAMEKLLRLQINRLPQRAVPEEEVRYPTSPAGMRAFLDTFFARHYFQVQNSLLEYLTSEDFLELLNTQNVSVLDIGAGPAVASLAITDIVARVIRQLSKMNWRANSKIIKIRYILNDTANICLGTGQELITSHFIT